MLSHKKRPWEATEYRGTVKDNRPSSLSTGKRMRWGSPEVGEWDTDSPSCVFSTLASIKQVNREITETMSPHCRSHLREHRQKIRLTRQRAIASPSHSRAMKHIKVTLITIALEQERDIMKKMMITKKLTVSVMMMMMEMRARCGFTLFFVLLTCS